MLGQSWESGKPVVGYSGSRLLLIAFLALVARIQRSGGVERLAGKPSKPNPGSWAQGPGRPLFLAFVFDGPFAASPYRQARTPTTTAVLPARSPAGRIAPNARSRTRPT